jgi:hypothetical protein
VDQLKEWRKYFDEDQVLVLKSEDLFERPKDTLATVRGFFGQAPWEADDLDDSQEAHHEGSYRGKDPALRERLEAYFGPHNRRLYESLGADFGW